MAKIVQGPKTVANKTVNKAGNKNFFINALKKVGSLGGKGVLSLTPALLSYLKSGLTNPSLYIAYQLGRLRSDVPNIYNQQAKILEGKGNVVKNILLPMVLSKTAILSFLKGGSNLVDTAKTAYSLFKVGRAVAKGGYKVFKGVSNLI